MIVSNLYKENDRPYADICEYISGNIYKQDAELDFSWLIIYKLAHCTYNLYIYVYC